MPSAGPKVVRPSLAKVSTGIQGLDEITGGGLPKGRVTLVCGSAGSRHLLRQADNLLGDYPPHCSDGAGDGQDDQRDGDDPRETSFFPGSR